MATPLEISFNDEINIPTGFDFTICWRKCDSHKPHCPDYWHPEKHVCNPANAATSYHLIFEYEGPLLDLLPRLRAKA
ncbi:hypothetical protein O9K51_08590 [Purpureocillium lavendulum]|uniref:Uncharacterized protein n=1 Tax=Purpureocillium lavendulum TaxID=1247861 RepID=A0AB34FIE6_9HYPO|nr:hypothetical protein O9K51_08590 [Purpureocillium lavendulum]